MALVRWEPMSEIEQMRRRMERTLDRLMPRITWAPALRGEMEEVFIPDIDVYQTDDEVVLSAALPGIEPEGVVVEVGEDSVSISGESKRETEIREEGYLVSEREFGRFSRTIPLPNKVKDQEARATFRNGVLTVHIPLVEHAKRTKGHKVAIETK